MLSVSSGYLSAATLAAAGDLQAIADDNTVRFFRLEMFPGSVTQVGPAIPTTGQATVTLAICCGLKTGGLNAIIDNNSVRFLLITTTAEGSSVTQVGPTISTHKKATVTPAGDLQAVADDGNVRFFRLSMFPSAVIQVGPPIVTTGQATVALATCCGLKTGGLNAIIDKVRGQNVQLKLKGFRFSRLAARPRA
jgi:hypothetical protein